MSTAAKPVMFVVRPPAGMAAGYPSARTYALTFAVLALAAFACSFLPVREPLLWEEAAHLANAENLFSAQPYFREFDVRPPLLPTTLGVLGRFIPLETAARLIIALSFTGCVVLLFHAGSRLYGYADGLIAAALLLVSPFMLHWSHQLTPDLPAAALLLASMYALIRATGARGFAAGCALLAGFLLGAASLFNWFVVAGMVSAAYLVGIRRMRPKLLIAYAAGLLAAVAPYFIWSKVARGSLWVPLWTSIASMSSPSDALPGKFGQIESVFRIIGPIAAFGVLCWAYVVWREHSAKGAAGHDVVLLVCSGGVLLALYGTAQFRPEAAMPAALLMVLLAGRGFARLRHRNMLALLLLVLPLAAFLTLRNRDYFRGVEPWTRTMLVHSSNLQQAGLSLKSAPPAPVYVNHLWPVLAYHSKRTPQVLWPRDDRFYATYPRNMPQPGYFVLVRGVEKRPDEEWLNGRPEFNKLNEFGSVAVYQYLGGASAPLSAEFRPVIEEARREFARGSYDTVLEILAVIKVPHADAGDLRGWSYYRMGRIREASESFRQGLLVDPSNPRCLTGLGYTELRLGMPDLARGHFEAALRQVPDKADALVGLGIAQLHRQDKPAAAAALRRALELSPDNNEAREYLRKAETP